MTKIQTIVQIPIEQVEIHPEISSLISTDILAHLCQQGISRNTLESINQPLFMVSRKAGMRKNKKYVISQNILRYMACLQAKVFGLPVVINAVVIDQLEPAMIQDLFLWELMGAKRDQSGHAIIAKLYQRIERLKCENKQHPFAKANIKDTTSKQSHTLRALSGFDGRSFNNFQKSAQLPENVKAFVEELI